MTLQLLSFFDFHFLIAVISACLGLAIYLDYKSTIMYPNYKRIELNLLVKYLPGCWGFRATPMIYGLIATGMYIVNAPSPFEQQFKVLVVLGVPAVAHTLAMVNNRMQGRRLKKQLT